VRSTSNYGSGFLDGDVSRPPAGAYTVDLALGKSFGENWNLRFSALNVANNHYRLDNSNTFGGSHFTNAREFAFQLKLPLPLLRSIDRAAPKSASRDLD